MKAAVPAIALVLAALLVPAGDAAAQRDDGRHRQAPAMSSDQRQHMREDMREVYRERGDRNFERARPERPRQLTPEERAKLRQDVQNANKDLRR